MARLAYITKKEQIAAKDHAVFDAIAASRGAVQGPFTMFMHCPEISGRVAISAPMCASRVGLTCACGCWRR